MCASTLTLPSNEFLGMEATSSFNRLRMSALMALVMVVWALDTALSQMSLG